MSRTILFNHIPRTGGTTFRIILNRVYGENRVFFIRSKNIAASLNEFRGMSGQERKLYKVVSGHGAELFVDLIKDPFRITIMREPVSLFLSQYHYLKVSPNSTFLDEVTALNSVEEYLDFAVAKGQDNLLTRYLSNSLQFLADAKREIPKMEHEGDRLLRTAKDQLFQYDTILSTNDLDKGIYGLSKRLNWKSIPLYRSRNRSIPADKERISEGFLKKLQYSLRFDIELYDCYKNIKTDPGVRIKNMGFSWQLFQLRQFAVKNISLFLKDD